MSIFRDLLLEIVDPGSGYKPVGIHEMSIFYGTGTDSTPPATQDEQDEFHDLLEDDEQQAFEYLNNWLVGRGLDPLEIVDR